MVLATTEATQPQEVIDLPRHSMPKLRTILLEEMHDLRHGTVLPHHSIAMAQLARQIVNSARAEMELYQSMRG